MKSVSGTVESRIIIQQHLYSEVFVYIQLSFMESSDSGMVLSVGSVVITVRNILRYPSLWSLLKDRLPRKRIGKRP